MCFALLSGQGLHKKLPLSWIVLKTCKRSQKPIKDHHDNSTLCDVYHAAMRVELLYFLSVTNPQTPDEPLVFPTEPS